jgi:hypothetical protein
VAGQRLVPPCPDLQYLLAFRAFVGQVAGQRYVPPCPDLQYLLAFRAFVGHVDGHFGSALHLLVVAGQVARHIAEVPCQCWHLLPMTF